MAAELRQWSEDDQPLPEDAEIDKAGPWNDEGGDGMEYTEAMRLVGAKRSKAALVALVNWLLVRISRHAPAAPASERISTALAAIHTIQNEFADYELPEKLTELLDIIEAELDGTFGEFIDGEPTAFMPLPPPPGQAALAKQEAGA